MYFSFGSNVGTTVFTVTRKITNVVNKSDKHAIKLLKCRKAIANAYPIIDR